MSARTKFAAYLELGKLRLSSLAVFAVLAGLYLGSPDFPEWGLVVSTLAGTVLVAIGGNALNMFLERDVDLLMDRTEDRPLPAGRLGSREVLVFGCSACILGLG